MRASLSEWDYNYERGYAIAVARDRDDLADAFGTVYANDFAKRYAPAEAFDQWVRLRFVPSGL